MYVNMKPMPLVQDPGDFWDAATLVDAFNSRKDPNETLTDAAQSFTDYYLLSSVQLHIKNLRQEPSTMHVNIMDEEVALMHVSDTQDRS